MNARVMAQLGGYLSLVGYNGFDDERRRYVFDTPQCVWMGGVGRKVRGWLGSDID